MPRSKRKRDKNAPRRNISAYLHFQNGMRDNFRKQHPDYSFGELSKLTSKMYASLSVEEKAFWQHKADLDKARYLDEMSRYVPSLGFDEKGEAVIPANSFNKLMETTTMKIKKIKCKDPNAPKRNISAYLIYQNTMRDQFKADNPDMSFGQLSSYTSYMYKNLTPEEKAQWEKRAIEDKERYENEMSRYNPPEGFDRFGVLIDKNPLEVECKRAKKFRDPKAPKRSRGSYVFFTNHIRPIILKEKPDIPFIELGNIMGERWRNISPEEKKLFEAMAKEDRERFRREMDAYKAKQMKEAELSPDEEYDLPLPQTVAAVPNSFQCHNTQNQMSYYDHNQNTVSPNSTIFQPLHTFHEQMYQYQEHYQPMMETATPFDGSNAFIDQHFDSTNARDHDQFSAQL